MADIITEDYVSFEVAKLLKEKGFEGFTMFSYSTKGTTMCGHWENEIDWMPKCTLQMAMEWLRKIHNIHIELNWDKGNQLYSFQIWKQGKYQPEISSLDLWRIHKDDNYLGEWIYEKAC